jgi:uroporphyrinogen-III synthase
MANLPLTGKTILVTRSAGQSSQFTQLLTHAGATVIEMPALEIVAPSSWESLDCAIANLSTFNWLILTSSNAVDYFFDRLITQGQNISNLGGMKIAVVGEKTAQVLKQRGLQPDFIPPNFVADSLVEKFPEALPGKKILFPRVETGGREVLVNEFTAKGAEVVEVAAYQSSCPRSILPEAVFALQNRTVDVITFASSKTVKFFCQLVGKTFNTSASLDTKTGDENPDKVVKDYLQGVCIASIGPQTSKSCLSLIGRVDVEAQEYTLDGLTQALIEWSQQ